MADSPVFLFDSKSPALQQAIQIARHQFRYFWREMTWEQRRIVKGLSIASVKAPFTDEGKVTGGLVDKLFGWLRPKPDPDAPTVEQMWLGDIEFDGQSVHGVLLNSPNWIRSVREGDHVEVPLDDITDWMYAVGDEVCGGFTVQALRGEMSPEERQGHDEAWGLEFPDPQTVKLVPEGWTDEADGPEEHPMARNSEDSLREQLGQNPDFAKMSGDYGWTMLHSMAAGGSCVCSQALLDHGADVNARTSKGDTPLMLAERLGWDDVAQLLKRNGAE